MKKLLFKSIAIGLLTTSGLISAQEFDAGMSVNYTNDPSNNGEIQFSTDGQSIEKGFIPGQIYYLYFNASSAAPISQTAGKTYFGAGCVYNSATGSLDASLQLPDGHTIRGFRYYWDDASASSTSAAMITYDGAGGFTTLNTIQSTGDTGFDSVYENLPGGDVVVNNATTAYSFRFFNSEAGSAQKMCGVRVAMVAP